VGTDRGLTGSRTLAAARPDSSPSSSTGWWCISQLLAQITEACTAPSSFEFPPFFSTAYSFISSSPSCPLPFVTFFSRTSTLHQGAITLLWELLLPVKIDESSKLWQKSAGIFILFYSSNTSTILPGRLNLWIYSSYPQVVKQ
jgi:hypothetical protein